MEVKSQGQWASQQEGLSNPRALEGVDEADDGDVGKSKIMNCRETNSQNELAALRLHSTVVGKMANQIQW